MPKSFKRRLTDIKQEPYEAKKRKTSTVESKQKKIESNIAEAKKLLNSSSKEDLDPKYKEQCNAILNCIQEGLSTNLQGIRTKDNIRFSTYPEKSTQTANPWASLDIKLSNSQRLLETLQKGEAILIGECLEGGLTIDYSSGTALDQKAFSGIPKEAVDLAKKLNRKDVLDKLPQLAKEQGIPMESLSLAPEGVIAEIEKSLTTPDTTSDGLLKDHPKPPKSRLLNIHEQSLKMLSEAKSGQTFTGTVHIIDKERQKYKIYLVPM